MRVFCASLPFEASGKVYDGCRRGISGLGGAGARGYLVIEREEAGEVGDFRASGEMPPDGKSPDTLPWDAVDCALRCFRCRIESSEWSFIRMDLRAGAISSEFCIDFDRVCRAGELASPYSSSLIGRSDSDSEDNPDDDELDIGRLMDLTGLRRLDISLPRRLLRVGPLSSNDSGSSACANNGPLCLQGHNLRN